MGDKWVSCEGPGREEAENLILNLLLMGEGGDFQITLSRAVSPGGGAVLAWPSLVWTSDFKRTRIGLREKEGKHMK